jgi:hypothetical protein
MLNFRFRFGLPQRDRENDQARLAGILRAVRSTTADAQSELSGLQGRVEKARQSAAMLLENDMDDGPARESKLKKVEARCSSAKGGW